MPTVTTVNDLKINRLTEAQYDAAVQAGIIGENELSIITDLEGGQVIQVDTLPTASVDELDKIYQYIGTTDQDYTNGYFYKCVENIISSSATATQTVGSNLSNLSVDVNVFENKEQPTTSGNFDFVAKFISEHTTFNTISGDETVSGNIYQILSNKGKSSEQYWNGVIVFTNNASCYVGPEVGTVWFNTDVYELSIFGIQIVDPEQPSVGDYIEYSYRPDEVVWQKSNNTININEYGISYSGSPVADNKITVAYTMETRYFWQQVDVQPAPVIPDPLPSQSGNSGKFLTTDGTDASWGDALVNQATNNALSVMTAKSSTQSTYIGYEAGSNSGNYSVYIGYGANSNGGSGHYNVCIGASAHTGSNVGGAIQLGQGLNSESGTMCVALSDSVGSGRQNYKLLDLDGTIPEARLADTTNTQEGQVLTLDSNGQATWSSAAKTPQTMPELTANGWALDPNTNKITQTVNVTGVTATNNVIVSPAPNSTTDYSDASILCTAQGSGTLTFTCETTPTNAITVNVLIF